MVLCLTHRTTFARQLSQCRSQIANHSSGTLLTLPFPIISGQFIKSAVCPSWIRLIREQARINREIAGSASTLKRREQARLSHSPYLLIGSRSSDGDQADSPLKSRCPISLGRDSLFFYELSTVESLKSLKHAKKFAMV